MDLYRNNNLKIQSKSMGQLVISPNRLDLEDLKQSGLVLFPFRISDKQKAVLVEWAGLSQAPIFCHKSDIAKLEEEGFGAYRFHSLQNLREVDFQGGSLEFFPARRPKGKNLIAKVQGLGEYLEMLPVYSFHTFIRPLGEKSVVYLASPQLEDLEYKYFLKEKASIYVAARGFEISAWAEVEKRLGQSLIHEGQKEVISTARTVVGKEAQAGAESAS